MASVKHWFTVASACSLLGCGDPKSTSDDPPRNDAATDTTPDAAPPPPDAAPPPPDAAPPPPDAAPPPPDAAPPPLDAAPPPPDRTPPPPDAASDPCARNAACGTCTPVNGCGWCSTSGACVTGTAAGPSAGSCAGRWAWLPSECAATTDAGVAMDAVPAVGCPNEQRLTFNVSARGSTTTPGWDVPLTAWFARSDVACSPATMSALSAGPYQVYTIDMPARSDWEVALQPDPGVDVGIAGAWLQSSTATACYPARDYSVVTCEAAIRNGPGVLERVRLNATTNPYRVYILVNTPSGGARGGYSLAVRPWGTADAGVADAAVDAGAAGCPTERRIAFDTDVRGSTSDPGWSASLTSWFARSDVACSPATLSAQTAAPYQVYSVDMPPRSDWSVVLTPAPGVDANLAAVWQQSAGEDVCLPLADRAVAAACEYGARGGAGVAERVRLNAATVGYRVRILVNTPSGAAPGAFTLRVQNYP